MPDYQESVTTGQTDGQTPNKVIPMYPYASQVTQKTLLVFTEGTSRASKAWQTDKVITMLRFGAMGPQKLLPIEIFPTYSSLDIK